VSRFFLLALFSVAILVHSNPIIQPFLHKDDAARGESLEKAKIDPVLEAELSEQKNYLKNNPDSPVGHFKLANAYYRLNKFREAEYEYKKAKELIYKSKKAKGLHFGKTNLWSLGQWKFGKINQWEFEAMLHYNWANALMKLSNYKEAIKSYISAKTFKELTKDKKFPKAEHNLAAAKRLLAEENAKKEAEKPKPDLIQIALKEARDEELMDDPEFHTDQLAEEENALDEDPSNLHSLEQLLDLEELAIESEESSPNKNKKKPLPTKPELNDQQKALQAAVEVREIKELEELKEQVEHDSAYQAAQEEIENGSAPTKNSDDVSHFDSDDQLAEMGPGGDDKRVFYRVYPKEGKNYAVRHFDEFNPATRRWSSKTEEFSAVPEDRSFDDQGNVPFTIITNLGSADIEASRIPLTIREGYGVDPSSIKFLDSGVDGSELHQGTLGNYVLHFAGSPKQGARLSYTLKKLTDPTNAARPPSDRDTVTWIDSIPQVIKNELEPRLAVAKTNQEKADAIEAYILRRARYMDNDDPDAGAIRTFVNQAKGGQARFEQMARILLQDQDPSFPIKNAGMNCELWTEFYVALVRYYGIPARRMSGFSNRFPMDNELTGNEGHAWASFWSEEEKQWLWRNPTPRGELTAEQKERMESDQIKANLDDIDVDFSEPEPRSENEGSHSGNLMNPNQESNPEAEADEDSFGNWLGDTFSGSREYTEQERKKLYEMVEKMAKYANELRLKHPPNKGTPMEKIMAASKYRAEQIKEEVELTNAIDVLGKRASILSVKKHLTPEDELTLKKYKETIRAIPLLALRTLQNPQYDPKSDPYKATADVQHSLALLEAVINHAPEDPQKIYTRIVKLAKEQLESMEEVALYQELVAYNSEVQIIRVDGKLFKQENNQFVLTDLDFDSSKYENFKLGTVSEDGKHYAFIAQKEGLYYLVRDGTETKLNMGSVLKMHFTDDKGETLLIGGTLREGGDFNPYVLWVNGETHERDFSTLSSYENAFKRKDLGFAYLFKFDERGFPDRVATELWKDGKAIIDPKTQKPLMIDHKGERRAGSFRTVSEDNFIVDQQLANGKHRLLENGTRLLLEGTEEFDLSQDSKNLGRVHIKTKTGGTTTHYLYEDGKITEIAEAPKVDSSENKEKNITDTFTGGYTRFSLDNQPLYFENGDRVQAKSNYWWATLYGNFIHFYHFSDRKKGDVMGDYLASNLFELDTKTNHIKAVPIVDESGQPVSFDLISDVDLYNKEKVGFLARKDKKVFVVIDGKVNESLPDMRANPTTFEDFHQSGIVGDLDISDDGKHFIMYNGGWNQPYSVHIDNVPVITTPSAPSVSILRYEDDIVFKLYSQNEYLLSRKPTIQQKVDNIDRRIVSGNVETWQEKAKPILEQEEMTLDDLQILVENQNFFSGTDQTGGELARTVKEKIVDNILLLPVLPMSRIKRVQAVIRALDWKRDMPGELQTKDLERIAIQMKRYGLAEPLLEILLDAEENSAGLDVSVDSESYRRPMINTLRKVMNEAPKL